MREEVIKKIKFNSTSWCETNGSYYLVRINHIGHTVEFEW